jgi:hypothetical protein
MPADLLAATRLVAAGEALLAPSVTKRLIEAYVARPEQLPAPSGLDELTARASSRCCDSSRAATTTARSHTHSSSAR